MGRCGVYRGPVALIYGVTFLGSTPRRKNGRNALNVSRAALGATEGEISPIYL
jgi:hypothetical protein